MIRSRETDGRQAASPAPAGDPQMPDLPVLRQLVDGAPVLMRRCGDDGRCDWFNRGWLDYTGRSLERERGLGWTDNVHPDDLERCREAWRAASLAGGPYAAEVRLRRHDGSYRWFRDSGQPFVGDDGEPAGHLCFAVDITDRVERREAERRHQSLVDSLNHRMKNTLATVHSIALQTFRKIPDAEPALRLFDGRLSAVAASQDLLARRDWRGATIRETAETALRPFGAPDGSLIEIAGPEVRLTPRQTMALGYAFHELGANATRFGSLSAGGRVSVRWQTTDAGFVLTWREHGGPPVTPPARKGFGARMIERGLIHEFGGSAEIDFASDGLVCTIRAGLPPDRPAG